MYENRPPIEIYQRVKNAYGESTISIERVRKLFRKFGSCYKNIVGKSCSGRLVSVVNKTLENKVDGNIQCN